jgi:hypothetical protein
MPNHNKNSDGAHGRQNIPFSFKMAYFYIWNPFKLESTFWYNTFPQNRKIKVKVTKIDLSFFTHLRFLKRQLPTATPHLHCTIPP